ncbi:hypothetical protein V8C86DRAFT_2467630 [Haematococcus lacustris]
MQQPGVLVPASGLRHRTILLLTSLLRTSLPWSALQTTRSILHRLWMSSLGRVVVVCASAAALLQGCQSRHTSTCTLASIRLELSLLGVRSSTQFTLSTSLPDWVLSLWKRWRLFSSGAMLRLQLAMDVTRLAAMQPYSIQPPGHKPSGPDADIDSQARVGTADGITDRITEAQSSCIQAFLAAHSSHFNSVWHCTFEAHSTSDSEAEAAPGPGLEVLHTGARPAAAAPPLETHGAPRSTPRTMAATSSSLPSSPSHSQHPHPALAAAASPSTPATCLVEGPGTALQPRERSAMHHTRWRRANSVSGDPEGWRLPGDQLRWLDVARQHPPATPLGAWLQPACDPPSTRHAGLGSLHAPVAGVGESARHPLLHSCLSAAAHGTRRSMSSSDGLAAADCWQQDVQGLSSPGEEAL